MASPVRRLPASVPFRALLVGAAYFAAAELGHLLSFRTEEQAFASFWPPAGLMLAVLALNPLRHWPAYIAAGCTANLVSDVLLHGIRLPVSLGYSAANAVGAGFGVFLLRRFHVLPLSLERVSDVLALARLAACLGPLLGATLGATIAAVAYDRSFVMEWCYWWFADALGVITIAPFILAWATPRPNALPRWNRGRFVEGALLLIGVVVATESVYGEHLPVTFGSPSFVFPFMLWSAVRFPPRIVTLTSLLVMSIGIWNSTEGRGPYMLSMPAPVEIVFRVQAVAAIVSLCVLLLAAVIAERRRADEARIATVARLEQTLAELRTLKELIPMCAWCHRIQDDRTGWQRIETYLKTHMQTDVTHGICPECFDANFAPNESAEQAG